MVTDQEIIQRLNLVRENPRFVLRVNDDGSMNVLTPSIVPKKTGLYWVAGDTVLRNGQQIDSVFVIDTNSGAEQCNVYWHHEGAYYEHRESDELSTRLGLAQGDFFPYSWRYRVAIEGDVFFQGSR